MTPTSHRTLTSEREISAYLHHTRMAILQALRDGPATVSQIAGTLGVHPANLTRHMRNLAGADLVAIVERRDTGRNIEKYYQAAAETFDVAPEADTLTAPHKIVLAFARSDLSAALAQLPDEESRPVQVQVLAARLTPGQLAAFVEELNQLAARFEAADLEGAADASVYHLSLALYPCADREMAIDRRVVLSKDGET